MLKHSSNLGVGGCLAGLTPVSPITLYSLIFIGYLHESPSNWSDGRPRQEVRRQTQTFFDVEGKTPRFIRQERRWSPRLEYGRPWPYLQSVKVDDQSNIYGRSNQREILSHLKNTTPPLYTLDFNGFSLTRWCRKFASTILLSEQTVSLP